ncbi:hypothetical protein [Vulcanisaeta distributa]|uniref:archaellin/type IV pilin N-terminal domain-containing protein n=1 Tax=Vulcanisaeta distributa TaxID=164451 RepID=UPI0006D0FC30|nr:archaellin/type IV pilin N-terminal domain-containing protein [Vulcanisaeta distributa]
MATKMNRKGISNVVATIILIAVAIALAVAVAVWVFGLAGSASKTATLQVQALGLSGINTTGVPTLVFIVSNPSSTGIAINGLTLGSLTCVFNTPVQIAAGTQGGNLTIVLGITQGSSGTYYFMTGTGPLSPSSGSSSTSTSSSGTSSIQLLVAYYNGKQVSALSCSGNQTAIVGTQYSGYITTVSGQTYPFTVTATS